jgi:uridine kinase
MLDKMDFNQFVIGITGGSGVGKTTLIDILYQSFREKITVLSLDNYYKVKEAQSLDDNGIINFDLPSALDMDALERDFDSLLKGKGIKQKVYHFNHPERDEEFKLIEPNQIILVEGLFVMHYEFIKSRLDYKVYLSVDEEKQLERRLKRDVEERNYDRDDVLYQWNHHVKPAYANFIYPYKSESDLIIKNNTKFDENLEELMEVIRKNIFS